MQSLVGKIEQLTTSSHPDTSIKSLKDKKKTLNTVMPYYELMPNQSAVIFSDLDGGVEVSLAIGTEEDVLLTGFFMATALMQRIYKDPEFLEKVMELFEPDSEEQHDLQ